MKIFNTKVIVCIDTDGHFHSQLIDNRKLAWEVLTKHSHDGDYFYNCDEEWNDVPVNADFDYMSLSEEHWIDFLRMFECRGVLEILDI